MKDELLLMELIRELRDPNSNLRHPDRDFWNDHDAAADTLEDVLRSLRQMREERIDNRDRLAERLFVAEISRTGVGYLDDDKSARDAYDTAEAFLTVRDEGRRWRRE